MKNFLRIIFLIFLSAFLLIASFPKVDLHFLIWIALVPLLLILEESTPRRAFWAGYGTGFLFFAGSVYWLIYVTIPGMILMNLYLALYFGLFGVIYVLIMRRARPLAWVIIPSVWVVLEYFRAHLFSGFGWVNLGHSQYKNLPLIQIADITGLYGVSFIIVMVNLVIKDIFLCLRNKDKIGLGRVCVVEGGWVVVMLTAVWGYGLTQLVLRSPQVLRPQLSLGIIQANIPQELRWRPEDWPEIFERHLTLSRQVIEQRPDLIIWPETSFPGYLGQEPERYHALRAFVQEHQIPLLFGVVTSTKGKYYNSALLLSKDGEKTVQYDKLHLVPFGEYIPWRRVFPLLADIVPIDDFTAGEESTVFSLESVGLKGEISHPRFSVLICFEDAVAEIARAFVERGAHFLVNITNDAWFKDSQAPFLHLQSSVFRAVENRRSVVRSANTGVSGVIDETGRIIRWVEDQDKKKIFVTGTAVSPIRLNSQLSFYTKMGDIFAYFCFGCILWGFVRGRNPLSP